MDSQLCFDPSASVDNQDTVGSFLLNPSDNSPIAVNNGGLNVNLVGSSGAIEVTATDLDIRDLSAAQDNVAISDGTDTLAINADGSINVNATSQGPIKFRNASNVVVDVEEDTAPLPVKLQSLGGDINVTAGDLNVQLDHTGASFDSVRIGDGTELAAITTVSDLKVVDRADTALQVSQQSVTNAAFSQLAATSLTERKEIRIQNRTKGTFVELADSSGASNGWILPAGKSITLPLGPGVSIFAKGSSTNATTLNILEVA
jgi:hypothetical protein